jgi:hypothetical protein
MLIDGIRTAAVIEKSREGARVSPPGQQIPCPPGVCMHDSGSFRELVMCSVT